MDFRISRKRREALIALLLAFLFLTACDSQKKMQLRAQLTTLQVEVDSLRQAASDQESALAAAGQRLTQQNTDLNNFNTTVVSYMLDHKLAVAALVAGLGGASAALDGSNAYTDQAKQLGSAIAVVAAIWAIGHADEVGQVLQVLNRADLQVRGLQSAVTQTSLHLQAQQAAVQQAGSDYCSQPSKR
jgi:outer membrane murein-binding lipoprotein Lpp